ncbi:MAG: glycosyltransferase family 4 protein [Actinobacteria bacterium]|nr:glycosyltransferase family 4 protein [Actinomycetota bacterium]
MSNLANNKNLKAGQSTINAASTDDTNNTVKKIKVLMIAPTPFFADRGCHVKILEEVRALSRRNIDVKVVTYHIGRDIEGVDIQRIVNIPWYKKLEAGPSIHKYYLDLLLAFKAIKVAAKFKPDIIHAHLHEGVFAGKIVQLFIKKPLIADYQGSMVGEMLDHGFMKRNSLSFRFNSWLERTVNKWPQKIIFSSSGAKEFFLANFNVNPEKVVSFVEGTNTDEFHPGYDISQLRKKLNLPGDKKIVIYLGVLTSYQGIDILINSINDIRRKFNNVHFLIVGFPNLEYYTAMAQKLGVSDWVTFTGRVNHEDAPKYLNLGDIGLSLKLSKTEANGKLFGYMAVGLPCLVFDTKTNREILGDAGIYAEYNNKESFVEKLIFLLENEKTAKEYGKMARLRVLEKYTWDNAFSNFLDIYKDVLQKSKS